MDWLRMRAMAPIVAIAWLLSRGAGGGPAWCHAGSGCQGAAGKPRAAIQLATETTRAAAGPDAACEEAAAGAAASASVAATCSIVAWQKQTTLSSPHQAAPAPICALPNLP